VISIVDHPELVRELKKLERRARAGGRAMVDHPRGGHDDFANALCLAAVAATCAATEIELVGPIVIPKGGRADTPWLWRADAPAITTSGCAAVADERPRGDRQGAHRGAGSRSQDAG
jgi:hypothetical protein